MEVIQTAGHPQEANPPSYETVWAILQEVGRKQEENTRYMRESQEKFDRRQEEYARQMKESKKEFDRRQKEFDRRLGKLGNRLGEVIEYLVAPNLRGKFKKLGLNFPRANQNVDVADYDKKIFLEIDVMLENGDKALLVEVKTKLTTENIQEHIARLEKMRIYADLHGDRRAFLGAVAGVVVTSNVKEYALAQDFYVIEPSGETFNITPPNGQPKEW